MDSCDWPGREYETVMIPQGETNGCRATHAAASMETIKPQRLVTSIILWHLICVRDAAINLKCHTTTYLMRYQATRGRQSGATWHLSKKMSYSWLLRRQSAPSLSLQLRAFRGSAFPTPAQIKLHHCGPAAGDDAHNTKTIHTDWRVNRPARAQAATLARICYRNVYIWVGRAETWPEAQ